MQVRWSKGPSMAKPEFVLGMKPNFAIRFPPLNKFEATTTSLKRVLKHVRNL